MKLFWVYLAVSVLAVFAAGFMRGFGPGLSWISASLRTTLLRWLARGLGLLPAPRTALAHAVMVGEHRGRSLRLELGAGRLLLSLGARANFDAAPSEVTEHYVSRGSKSLGLSRGAAFEASTLVLEESPHRLWRPEHLRERLEELDALLTKVEEELASPNRLAEAARNTRLETALRARILEYRVRAHPEHPRTRELLAESRADRAPEVQIAAARLSGPEGSPTLLELARAPDRLSGRSQRALIDALLDLRPSGLETALLRVAAEAKAKTTAYLLAAVRGTPESLPVAHFILLASQAGREDTSDTRRAALRHLVEEHPSAPWRDEALELLSNPGEPAAFRQEVFEALLETGVRRPALEALRPIALGRSAMRAWAIGALAHHRGAKEAEWLFSLARRDLAARIPVLFAFGELEGRGEDWLLECLDSESPLVLEHALIHVENLGTPHALEPLRRLRERLDGDPASRGLVERIHRCTCVITARLQSPLGPSGGLSLVSEEEHRGALILSPPKGAVSEPERAT